MTSLVPLPQSKNDRFTEGRLHVALLVSFAGLLTWSAIGPYDQFTWFLEVLPALLALILLAATYRKFPLTSLAYVLIWFHAVILTVGGHYTYAEMPLFNWLRDTFALSRNYYDRLGHFVQGFVPAIITRELLLRTSPLQRGKWLFTIVVSICLAISASYELFEWGVAVATGTAADAFLGTQGDVWDTQWDMALALVGAVTSLVIFGSLHDSFLRKLPVKNSSRIISS